MELTFEFAKKISKPAKGAAGIILRSVSGTPDACSMIIMAADYQDIRAGIANYRMLTGHGITAVSRGKSLEIKAESVSEENFSAMDCIFDYAKALKFNTEDAIDVCEFYSEVFANKALTPVNIELSPDSLSLLVSTYIDDGEEAETIYSGLDEVCSKYNVGIVKEHPEQL